MCETMRFMRALAIFAVLIAGCSAYPSHRAPHDPSAWDDPSRAGASSREAASPSRGARAPRNAIEEVLTFAEAQIGKPYCCGGEWPRCFDCSGLAQTAWARAGVHIPRTTHDIARHLPEVSLDKVQAGDILWWPGHVAIYEGDGHMIDALNSREGVVRRSTLSERPHRAFRPIHI